MEEMTVDGATIAWSDTGSGEPTLLVHAGVFGAWFAPLAPRLPGRVIRMLRAGYADGPTPTSPSGSPSMPPMPLRCSTAGHRPGHCGRPLVGHADRVAARAGPPGPRAEAGAERASADRPAARPGRRQRIHATQGPPSPPRWRRRQRGIGAAPTTPSWAQYAGPTTATSSPACSAPTGSPAPSGTRPSSSPMRCPRSAAGPQSIPQASPRPPCSSRAGRAQRATHRLVARLARLLPDAAGCNDRRSQPPAAAHPSRAGSPISSRREVPPRPVVPRMIGVASTASRGQISHQRLPGTHS